jgi:acyl carrier protein
MPEQKPTREEIEEKIKEVISESIGIDKEKITPASKLRDDLGMDSFAGIELIYGAEDKFGISIPDDEAEKLVTIGDIVSIVEEALRQKNV